MIQTDIQLVGGGYTADVSSARGGICYHLYHKETGADILRTPRDEEHLAENVYLFGNPPLFPPNRIVGGRFDFDGRTYTLPLNEPDTGCHIHGAMWRMPFSIAELTRDHARLVYRAKAGEYIGFPHAFTFVRDYTLDENGLTERTEVTNDSMEKMPFLLAYHTTFNLPFLPDSRTEDLRFSLPVGREEMRTEKFIPTGVFRSPAQREHDMQSGKYTPVGTHLSAFYECNGPMRLTDTKNGVSVIYEGERERFPYRMLFQPADGTLMVCEPQTCAIDCFHLEGDPFSYGLIALDPAESHSFSTRIAIEKE
ncbi:MAG: aldose 1-epimerase [Clostridia bacterium]|nr:aldose 1-epimerase [Clostridia bacterium]